MVCIFVLFLLFFSGSVRDYVVPNQLSGRRYWGGGKRRGGSTESDVDADLWGFEWSVRIRSIVSDGEVFHFAS